MLLVSLVTHTQWPQIKYVSTLAAVCVHSDGCLQTETTMHHWYV